KTAPRKTQAQMRVFSRLNPKGKVGINPSLFTLVVYIRHHLHNRVSCSVFDDEGKDVTPHPLFHPDPITAASKQSKLLALSDYSGATGSVFLPFSIHYLFLYGTAEPDSLQDTKSRLLTSYNLSDVQVRQEEIKEQLTEEDLDKRVDIYLTETETLRMLDLPPVVVSVESEDAARVLERNKIYVDICKNRPGNDRFVEKMMQTINGAAKNKEVQCDKIIMEDKGKL
uniref:Dynein axonemal intermediate chain 4 n=1 Tax=Gallus gallus TaxID=9031 RepID=A0A8V0ZRL6_CHICK